MSTRIKISNSIGRGKHYFKQMLNASDGSPSNVYQFETYLNYNLHLAPRQVGDKKDTIIAVMPAGGPLLKVGDFNDDIQGNIVSIDRGNNKEIYFTFSK